jgi:hypothetical protein
MIAEALKPRSRPTSRARAPTIAFFPDGPGGPCHAEILARYLSSVRYSIRRLRRCSSARSEAPRPRPARAAEHFAHKLGEEVGHDLWAERDIGARVAPRGASRRPEAAILALYDYLEPAVDREPLLYLGYMLWAEYFTVLAGSEFARAVVERCDLPAEAISCVARHAELDREHTSEGLEAIDRLVEDPRMLAPMRASMRRAMAFFDQFCDELLQPAWSGWIRAPRRRLRPRRSSATGGSSRRSPTGSYARGRAPCASG